MPGSRPEDEWSDRVYESLLPEVAKLLGANTWLSQRVWDRFDEASPSVDCPDQVAEELNELYRELL